MDKELIKEAQKALNEKGFKAGPVDGIHGNLTTSAVSAFQRNRRLPITGNLDAATLKALLGRTVELSEPSWYIEAKRYLGIQEVRDEPKVLLWAKRIAQLPGLKWIGNYYNDSDIPWCGLFVGHVMSLILSKEPIPSNPLGAKEWNKYGVPLTTPTIGAILVFTRSGGGHVGFYAGETSTYYRVLGGNQSNSVSYTLIDKNRCIGIRWPSTVPLPTTGRVLVDSKGIPISKNEQ